MAYYKFGLFFLILLWVSVACQQPKAKEESSRRRRENYQEPPELPKLKDEVQKPGFLNEKQLEELKKALRELSELAKKKDWENIRKNRIDNKAGLCIMYRFGVMNRFGIIENLSDSMYYDLPEASIFGEWEGIAYMDVPNFFYFDTVDYDCDKMRWNKRGAFLSKDADKKFVSNTINNYMTGEFGDIDPEEIKHILRYKNDSIQLVIADSNLVLYFIEVKGKFYLSLIDMATVSCSA